MSSLLTLKNEWKGETVCVLCTGPSAPEVYPTLPPMPTIACNRAYEIARAADVWVCLPVHVYRQGIEKMHAWPRRPSTAIVFGNFASHVVPPYPYGERIGVIRPKFGHETPENPTGHHRRYEDWRITKAMVEDAALEANLLFSFWGAHMGGVHVALIGGAAEIVLVGCDFGGPRNNFFVPEHSHLTPKKVADMEHAAEGLHLFADDWKGKVKVWQTSPHYEGPLKTWPQSLGSSPASA